MFREWWLVNIVETVFGACHNLLSCAYKSLVLVIAFCLVPIMSLQLKTVSSFILLWVIQTIQFIFYVRSSNCVLVL